MLKRIDHEKLARIFFFSSVSVYGNTSIPALENSEIAPINEYGRQKLATERELIRHSNKVVVLRISNVIADVKLNDFLNSSLLSVRNSEGIKLFKGNDIYRDFIPMEDLIRVLIQLMQSRISRLPQTLNIATGTTSTYKTLVEIMEMTLNLKLQTQDFSPDFDKVIVSSVIDSSLLKSLLPYSPSILHNYLPMYIASFISGETHKD